jgi:hypothetical protein
VSSRKSLTITIAAAALIFGTLTTLFSALDTGDTADEKYYRYAGSTAVESHQFEYNHEHPPLSKWSSAILPVVTGRHEVTSYRLTHVALYLAYGIALSWLVALGAGWGAGSAFACIYSLSPTLKAFASLHVTDFDCAALGSLALAVAWLAHRRRAPRILLASITLAAMAAACKFTGLLFIAFSGLSGWALLYREYGRTRRFAKEATVFFLSSILVSSLVLFAAYHFRFSELHWYWDGISFQRELEKLGRFTFLLGKESHSGFAYYFAVLLLFKTPLVILALWTSASVYFFRVARAPRFGVSEFAHFVLPAWLMIALFSAGRVQIGIRYILPSMLLLTLAAAIWVDCWLECRIKKAQVRRAVAAIAIVSLLVSDLISISLGDYLSYFNFMAPSPTRNFSDSNIDWGQGIPAHLQKNLEKTFGRWVAVRSFSPMNDIEPGKTGPLIVAGASELNGDWFMPARKLKTLSPLGSLGGYEIFGLTDSERIEWLRMVDEPAPGSNASALCRPRSVRELRPEEQVPAHSDALVILNADKDPGDSIRISGQPLRLTHSDLGPNEWRAWIAATSVPRPIEFGTVWIKKGKTLTWECP